MLDYIYYFKCLQTYQGGWHFREHLVQLLVWQRNSVREGAACPWILSIQLNTGSVLFSLPRISGIEYLQLYMHSLHLWLFLCFENHILICIFSFYFHSNFWIILFSLENTGPEGLSYIYQRTQDDDSTQDMTNRESCVHPITYYSFLSLTSGILEL